MVYPKSTSSDHYRKVIALIKGDLLSKFRIKFIVNLYIIVLYVSNYGHLWYIDMFDYITSIAYDVCSLIYM